jgi:hypothetical protein
MAEEAGEDRSSSHDNPRQLAVHIPHYPIQKGFLAEEEDDDDDDDGEEEDDGEL